VSKEVPLTHCDRCGFDAFMDTIVETPTGDYDYGCQNCGSCGICGCCPCYIVGCDECHFDGLGKGETIKEFHDRMNAEYLEDGGTQRDEKMQEDYLQWCNLMQDMVNKREAKKNEQ
jgi:hypothetical protein